MTKCLFDMTKLLDFSETFLILPSSQIRDLKKKKVERLTLVLYLVLCVCVRVCVSDPAAKLPEKSVLSAVRLVHVPV